MHRWNSRFFMFATFASEEGARGTQVLAADSPEGPYVPWSNGPVTPAAWQCLDATLHIDEDGEPWMVFCHEWLQVGDGAMYAQRLRSDLSGSEGEPTLLFLASEAPWARPLAAQTPEAFVTDGPWLRTVGENLMVFWSSHSEQGYALGVAESTTGRVLGPWTHRSEPLWDTDGGHGMSFDTFEGESLLVFHRPNESPLERAELHPLRSSDGLLGRDTPASVPGLT